MPDGSFVYRMNNQSKSGTPPDVHIVFPAQELAVRRALQSVCSSLKALGAVTDTLITVEIILAEVTNNIVEHAYADTSSGTISLSCCKCDQFLKFEVIDQGVMFPGGELPPKQHHNLSADIPELPEGGFGWGLIRDLTSDLAYRRQNGENTLRFSIKCDAA